MPPALAMCLCLMVVLFSGAFVGLSYAQLKLSNPKKDGYFKLQDDLAARLGMEEWAAVQRSRTVRMVSFILSLALFLASLFGAVWFGASAFVPA